MELSLLVSVGTDHHPFPRLIEWADAWVADRRTAQELAYVVQHGGSPPSTLGDNRGLIPHDELMGLMRMSDLVVVQGGPGSILDARTCGRRPVAVPRTRALGEAVDDHQHPFCDVMASEGFAHVVRDRASLHELLDRMAAEPELGRCAPAASPAPRVAASVNAEIAAAVAEGAGFVRWSRLGQLRRVGRSRLGAR